MPNHAKTEDPRRRIWSYFLPETRVGLVAFLLWTFLLILFLVGAQVALANGWIYRPPVIWWAFVVLYVVPVIPFINCCCKKRARYRGSWDLPFTLWTMHAVVVMLVLAFLLLWTQPVESIYTTSILKTEYIRLTYDDPDYPSLSSKIIYTKEINALFLKEVDIGL